MDFNLIKEIIGKDKDLNNLDINHRLLIKLCKDHFFFYKALVIEYLPSRSLQIDEVEKIMKHDFSYLFYRPAFFFITLLHYVYTQEFNKIKEESNNLEEDLKDIYLNFLRYGRKLSYDTHKDFTDAYINHVKKNFSYLYEKVIGKPNVYLSVYFNNMNKYFFPLPYEVTKYSILTTFRKQNNTKDKERIFNKRLLDYVDQPTKVDHVYRKNPGKPKYLDKIKNEMCMTIPLKYLRNNQLDNDDILIMGTKIGFYVTKNNKITEDTIKGTILFKREHFEFDFDKYMSGLPLELLTPMWKEGNDELNISRERVTFVQIGRKIKPEDLFNVFDKTEFSTDDYKYLFQNTPIPTEQALKVFDDLPTFWFFSPWTSFDKYVADERKCFRYKIKQKIDNIVDLTVSIITSNPFHNPNTQNMKKFYNLVNVSNHDINNMPELKESIKNRCLSIENNLDDVKNNKFCDVNKPVFYSGRRRIQELFLKNRTYGVTALYISHKYSHKYANKYKLDEDYKYYNNLYYPDKKSNRSIHLYDFDKYCLKDIGSNGFFFTNYDANMDGGEIMLAETNKYLEFDKNFAKTCVDIPKQMRMKKKNAYISYLTGDSIYFLGAMVTGYSLKQTAPDADVILMVTESVPPNQIELLQDFFQVVHIKEIEAPKRVFKEYEWSRFKHVFTKLEALNFVEYAKIIFLDIDILIVKNIDELFKMQAPAATCIYHKFDHGQLIPKKYMIKKPYMISYGINAGVMVFEPSTKEFNRLINDVNTNLNYKLKNPEQEFLSIVYANNFHHIDIKYNFQTFKFADKYPINYGLIHHYSSRVKPWMKFIDREFYNRKVVNLDQSFRNSKIIYQMWHDQFDKLQTHYSTKEINLLEQFRQINRKYDPLKEKIKKDFMKNYDKTSFMLSYYKKENNKLTTNNFYKLNSFELFAKDKKLKTNLIIDYHRVLSTFGKTAEEKLQKLEKISKLGYKITLCSYVTNDLLFDVVDKIFRDILKINNKLDIDAIVYMCKKEYNEKKKIKFYIASLLNAQYIIDDHVINLDSAKDIQPILYNSSYPEILYDKDKFDDFLKFIPDKDKLKKYRNKYLNMKSDLVVINKFDKLIEFLNKQ